MMNINEKNLNYLQNAKTICPCNKLNVSDKCTQADREANTQSYHLLTCRCEGV